MIRRPLDFDALRHFVAGVPALRDALALPVGSAHELMLQGEIRRTALALSELLATAAGDEADGDRAATLLAAARVAAGVAVDRRGAPRAGH